MLALSFGSRCSLIHMSHHCSKQRTAAWRGSTPRSRGVCDKAIVGWVLLTLVHSTEALAGDQALIAAQRTAADFNASWHSVPLPETQTYPSREFRPHGPSLLEKNPVQSSTDEAPMLRGTTVWQRMSDYRSHDRLRVVTLWETGGSSVSLQANRKGDPSLQWTSRLMNRGGSTRGLLDQWFSTSVAGIRRGPRPESHSTHSEPAVKSAKILDAGPGSNGPGAAK